MCKRMQACQLQHPTRPHPTSSRLPFFLGPARATEMRAIVASPRCSTKLRPTPHTGLLPASATADANVCG
jgi:hypothetical protein